MNELQRTGRALWGAGQQHSTDRFTAAEQLWKSPTHKENVYEVLVSEELRGEDLYHLLFKAALT